MTDYNASRRFIAVRNESLVGINRGRNSRIIGITVHSTRSGAQGAEYDDGPGTERYFGSMSNRGGFADMLIHRTGQQVQCTRWEVDEEPYWAAGWGDSGRPFGYSMQDYYLQAEVSQARIDQPYSAESIDSLAQWVAEMAQRYAFPIVRTGYVDQLTVHPAPPGISAHDDCANGDKLGKSDPGPLFPWDEFIAKARAYAGEGVPMTPDELKRLERLERIVAGNGVEYEGKRITGEAALQLASAREWSVLLGIKFLRDDVGALQAAGAVVIGGVPDHTHTPGGVER